jgi:cobalt/nickel transport system permease protein
VSVAHPHAAFVHGSSVAHRLPAHAKIVALAIAVVAVVATPAREVWAFVAYAILLVGVAVASGLKPGTLARRLALGAPFLLFAVALPFVGGGPRVALGPTTVSIEGSWAAWSVVAKGGLCLLAGVILLATTPVSDVLEGFSRLRVPATLTGIAGFMVRYVDLLQAEVRRARIAMAARGYRGRWLWNAAPVAGAAGSLFVRAHERGERVHGAMLARGYSGDVPRGTRAPASTRQWFVASVAPAVACAIAAIALVASRGAAS